jgi:uncharacterized protein (TIGR03000 family)
MIRKFSYKLAAGVLSLAVVVATASEASAGWRWHGSSGGSSGGYGSSGGWGGGSSGGGYGGSSGGWGGGSSGGWSGGSSGGGWGGWHKHGLFSHKRWGGGSSGGWGGGSSGGGSSGGWSGGSSGGYGGGWGSSGGSGGGSYYYAPGVEIQGKAIPVDPSTAPAIPVDPTAPPVPGTQETSIRRADGLLAVSVPQDAKIYVNGSATSSTGTDRQYVSRDLDRGFNYTYEVKAEVVRDGKTIEQVKTVNLRAGQTADLAFDFPAAAALETALTVHVPADAKVYLAGNPTSAKGETRVFRTTGLNSGKAWDDYTVTVEFEQDGQIVKQERKITLRAGEAQELSFTVEAEKVAAR